MGFDRSVRLRCVTLSIALILMMFLGACRWTTCRDKLVSCRKNFHHANQRISSLEKELAVAEDNQAALERQVDNLQGIEGNLKGHLPHVSKIKLAGLTGGYDDDDDRIDDGIVVYLVPVDSEGDGIKTAGWAVIKVFDLSKGDGRLVGEETVEADDLKTKWYNRFMTDHFTIRVPFTKSVKSSTVTVHVKFIELLTGREFTAQTACLVNIKSIAATQDSD